MIRLIALDLDGTLLDPAGRITQASKDAIARARAAGVRVLIRNDAYLGISPEERARRLENARQVAQEIVNRDYMRMIERGEWDGKAPAPPLKEFKGWEECGKS